ncbi:MauE/DoxX family redox-associated membrane protein [Polluticoccus soli]|uniref:MauE/DoxX family redox-associated membrane protein n=1 Tax=Polluticoccus soli TaxID=3034150 RepID=UPI0023E2DB68|nr:MauE/DoxX family redox-associated membrane protein [Flavipsychrobacter sp. JY13-12]
MADTIQKSGAIFYIKRILGLILLLALAAVFLFSAYSKLVSFEAFQWTFVDLGVSNIMVASVIARLFIGFEFLIAFFLLFHIYLTKVTYPATIFMLLALTGYLVFLLAKQGNTGNCGCFGDWIYMKPMEAIWKNVAMLAAVGLLYILYPVRPYKGQEWLAAIVTPFVLEPLNVNNTPEKANLPINLSLLYEAGSQKPEVELRSGKHIVAFMSLTCPHCRKAAYFLQVLKKNDPKLPIYLVLNGDPENFKAFFEESKAYRVPHMLFDNKPAFIELAGEYVPAIYWVNNSVIEYKSNYTQLDPQLIKKWVKQ